jgi:hypothetical protein
MVNLSAAMGGRFAEVTAEIVEQIRELGPNPISESRADPAPLAAETSSDAATSYDQLGGGE